MSKPGVSCCGYKFEMCTQKSVVGPAVSVKAVKRSKEDTVVPTGVRGAEDGYKTVACMPACIISVCQGQTSGKSSANTHKLVHNVEINHFCRSACAIHYHHVQHARMELKRRLYIKHSKPRPSKERSHLFGLRLPMFTILAAPLN